MAYETEEKSVNSTQLSKTMKVAATTVCATRDLIGNVNIVVLVEFYARLCSLLYLIYFLKQLTRTLGS